MKSFRQFLEQINTNELRAALGQIDAENSPAKRILRMREREKEKREKYKLKADETRKAQLRLLAQQTLKRQERANRQSGTEED